MTSFESISEMKARSKQRDGDGAIPWRVSLKTRPVSFVCWHFKFQLILTMWQERGSKQFLSLIHPNDESIKNCGSDLQSIIFTICGSHNPKNILISLPLPSPK